VEGGAAGHLPQRADLDARGVHVDEEGGQVAVPGPGRRPGQEEPDVAVVRSGRPHLLAVDDPVVTVAAGPGGDAGEVGPGARFGEELTADQIPAVESGKVPLPDALDGVVQDGR